MQPPFSDLIPSDIIGITWAISSLALSRSNIRIFFQPLNLLSSAAPGGAACDKRQSAKYVVRRVDCAQVGIRVGIEGIPGRFLDGG